MQRRAGEYARKQQEQDGWQLYPPGEPLTRKAGCQDCTNRYQVMPMQCRLLLWSTGFYDSARGACGVSQLLDQRSSELLTQFQQAASFRPGRILQLLGIRAVI